MFVIFNEARQVKERSKKGKIFYSFLLRVKRVLFYSILVLFDEGWGSMMMVGEKKEKAAAAVAKKGVKKK